LNNLDSFFNDEILSLKSSIDPLLGIYDILNVSITVPSSNVNILDSKTEMFSEIKIIIKSKKREGLSFVTIVNSKKFFSSNFLI